MVFWNTAKPGSKRLFISKKPRVFPFESRKTKARRSFNTQKKLQALSYWVTPPVPYRLYDMSGILIECGAQPFLTFQSIPVGLPEAASLNAEL